MRLRIFKEANRTKYGQLMVNHINNFTQETDKYLTNTTEAYNQVVNYKGPSAPNFTRKNTTTHPSILSSNSKSDEKSEDEVAFAQDAKNIRYSNCGELGHHKESAECSRTTKSATHLLMNAGSENGSN